MKSLKVFLSLVCLTTLIHVTGCGDDSEPRQRTYRMGFQNSAPRFDNFDMYIQSLNMWTTRADAAIITTEVPWEKILTGTNVVDHVVDNYKDLVSYYRDKGFELWVYIDPQNGLDRTSDAVELVEAGKSIADSDMQNIYRRFVIVMDSVLHPEHLGLALETNLIRAASPPTIYNGVKQAANLAAQDISALNPSVKVSVSVQAEQAWGRFTGSAYEGVSQDYIDFPFIDELGISSYPYFGFDDPGEIPIDYYSRIVDGKDFPVFVSEGGWTSASVTTGAITFESSPEEQRDYISRHTLLLDEIKATAYFQLVFTDIDIAFLPPDAPENLPYFAYLGMVDKSFQPKPALEQWDEIFKLSLIR